MRDSDDPLEDGYDDPRLHLALSQIQGSNRIYLPKYTTLYGWFIICLFLFLLFFSITALITYNELSWQILGVPIIDNEKIQRKLNLFTRLFGIIMGIILSSFFYSLLLIWLSELQMRLLAGPGGFVVDRGPRAEPEVYTWDNIAAIRYEPALQNHDPTKSGPPLSRNTYIYVLHVKGDYFGFWRDSLQNHKDFAKWLFAETLPRGIPWRAGGMHL